ncbi:helix-turn-helix domain-containing protein [Kitasatospora kifunensis]|nr:helix-turn-helix domain-containing protein [Kitasatospora kifunensis]
MVEWSWDGMLVPAIAVESGCSQKTVRRWLHRFNRDGLEGLDDLGLVPRLRPVPPAARQERQQQHQVVRVVPPGLCRELPERRRLPVPAQPRIDPMIRRHEHRVPFAHPDSRPLQSGRTGSLHPVRPDPEHTPSAHRSRFQQPFNTRTV